MLYLDRQKRVSAFVLNCPDLSESDENIQPTVGEIKNIFGKISVMFLHVIT